MRALHALFLLLAAASPLFADEPPAGPAAPPPARAGKKKPKDKEEPGLLTGFLSRAGLRVEPYGFVRVSASRDEQRTNLGNNAMWVLPPDTRPACNLTLRFSRLGLEVAVPDLLGGKASACLEADFFGGGAENKAVPRIRHAYLELSCPQGFYLLAGQTWDLNAGLCPRTLNSAVGWNGGNVGYRRPQIRLGGKFSMEGDAFVELQVAAARALGGITGGDLDGLGVDDGEDAAQPDVQGNVILSFPSSVPKKAMVLTLGGHAGAERLAGAGFFRTWSVVATATLPLALWLVLEGEFWTGANLDAYLGGVGQGIDTAGRRTIRSRGGFGQMVFRPCPWFQLVAGFGADDPVNDHLSAGARSGNRTAFGNVRFFLSKLVWVGVEYQLLRTDYLGGEEAEDHRVQASFHLGF